MQFALTTMDYAMSAFGKDDTLRREVQSKLREAENALTGALQSITSDPSTPDDVRRRCLGVALKAHGEAWLEAHPAQREWIERHNLSVGELIEEAEAWQGPEHVIQDEAGA